jgi:hypothetical protein
MEKTSHGNRKETHECRWFESRPEVGGDEAEFIPFLVFHNDISSPRSLIVPDTIATTSHPSGALGLSHAIISVPEAQLQKYLQTYHALLGSRLASPSANPGVDAAWRVGVPVANVKGLVEKHEPLIYVEAHEDKFDDGDGDGDGDGDDGVVDVDKLLRNEKFGGIAEVVLKTAGTGYGWAREMVSEIMPGGGGEVNICFVHGSHTTGRF